MERKDIGGPWTLAIVLSSAATYAVSIFALIASCWTSKASRENLVVPIRCKQSQDTKWKTIKGAPVSNDRGLTGEVAFDYGRCEGGMPVFEISQARSMAQFVEFDVVYSESLEGLETEQGDGPYFLFSNAMNTYRRETYKFDVNKLPVTLSARHAQQSQRYQKIIIRTPNSTVNFSLVGLRQLRRQLPALCSFTCSDDTLNRIYRDGVRTVELCTLEQREVPEAWEVTESGTRVYGQHWAPCRQGTRWGDIIVNFEVCIEQMGASWGIHIVANGLIFCLDLKERAVHLLEGLSHVNSVFPTVDRGSWSLGEDVMEDEWLTVQVVAVGSSIALKINGRVIGQLDGLDIRPLLGGSGNNTGSIGFGGPAGYTALYRNLRVTDSNGTLLYENDLLPKNKQRTLADFAVGSNLYPCTIDGAKRDRATFAGDLYVMARSIYYSTGRIEAVLGSISLLTSHQTDDGYLGNLCPVQAPLHDGNGQPPTYAFYSLSYALLLIPTIKEYWLHTSDENLVRGVWHRLDKLIQFVRGFVDKRGLVVAPPPLSMDWFPLGGPTLGASSKINLAYYEALTSLAKMSLALNLPDTYTAQAAIVKEAIFENLCAADGKSMKLSDISPQGVCQDVNGYAITTGIISTKTVTRSLASKDLPLAFENIGHLEKVQVVSPYATGFAAEASFISGSAHEAVSIIKRVWGIMVDASSVNYSGAHWEAMKPDGTPFAHDTSLAHGWSTWPTFLLPKYLGGVAPLEAGWKRWSVKPILAGLSAIDVSLQTVAGLVKLSLRIQEADGRGKMMVMIPRETTCEISAPKGWMVETESKECLELETLVIDGQNKEIVVRISRRQI